MPDPEPRLHSDLKPRGVPPAHRSDHPRRFAPRPMTLKEHQLNNSRRMLKSWEDDDLPRSYATAPDCELAQRLNRGSGIVRETVDEFVAATERANAYTARVAAVHGAWADEFGYSC